MTLSFEEARAAIRREVGVSCGTEEVALGEAGGRVLARAAYADRPFPAVDRSVRDGYAVRAQDLPGPLRVVGEVRAGESPCISVGKGEAAEIMTGALIPSGADTVVMVEHVVRTGDQVRYDREASTGQFIARAGEEAGLGQELVSPGKRISYSDMAMLAATGHTHVSVYRKPRVAILATGDELVEIAATPLPYQVRNSNVYSLAHQVVRCGGIPELLPVAPDREEATRELIERGLEADLLLLSGGVSAGKYDIVEQVLSSLGAQFFFDRVRIQPGQPVVFGTARTRFFFGLPGNPVSTMVTFEVFARLALERIGGIAEEVAPFMLGRLTESYAQKPGLVRFMPARLHGNGELTPVASKGSSDVAAVCRANCFLIGAEDRSKWEAGEIMPILWKEGF